MESEKQNTETKKNEKPLWLEYTEAFLVALVLAFFIRTFFVQAFKIPSESMLNTLYKGHDPQRGDIIIFEYPRDPSVSFIKRIIGVPGDVIEVRNKQLYRNGEPVREDYIRVDEPNNVVPVRDVFGPVTVPPDSYFCMGDNRDNSMDSRFWGFVKRRAIQAKARRIYWSWDGPLDVRWSRIGRAIH